MFAKKKKGSIDTSRKSVADITDRELLDAQYKMSLMNKSGAAGDAEIRSVIEGEIAMMKKDGVRKDMSGMVSYYNDRYTEIYYKSIYGQRDITLIWGIVTLSLLVLNYFSLNVLHMQFIPTTDIKFLLFQQMIPWMLMAAAAYNVAKKIILPKAMREHGFAVWYMFEFLLIKRLDKLAAIILLLCISLLLWFRPVIMELGLATNSATSGIFQEYPEELGRVHNDYDQTQYLLYGPMNALGDHNHVLFSTGFTYLLFFAGCVVLLLGLQRFDMIVIIYGTVAILATIFVGNFRFESFLGMGFESVQVKIGAVSVGACALYLWWRYKIFKNSYVPREECSLPGIRRDNRLSSDLDLSGLPGVSKVYSADAVRDLDNEMAASRAAQEKQYEEAQKKAYQKKYGNRR